MAPPPTDEAVVSAALPNLARAWAGPARGIGFWVKLAAAAGPGYLIAVGYMDPGNWATDIAGGSQFGFTLLPVILFSNFAAMFLQWLALRLGIATGRDLAQLCRERYSRPVALLLWIACEVAIVACDLAEVIGAAIALKLLFHLPMTIGVALTAFDTLIVMGLQKFGLRYVEAFVIALVGVIGASFAYEIAVSHPAAGAILAAFVPGAGASMNPAMLYLALGVFGATVMPHNLYLHSAIGRWRKVHPSPSGKREAIRFSTIDCFTALAFALLINMAIMVTAASAFHWSGHSGVATIEEAYKLLTPALGAGAASVVFAIALLAAGQSSTLTGTMAGQIAMQGFLGLKMDPRVQRLLTRGIAIVPALAVTAIAGESATARLLILSQVILSLQLGFAVIPLAIFTSDRKLMGQLVNGSWVRRSAYALGAAIVGVNGWLVVQTLAG